MANETSPVISNPDGSAPIPSARDGAPINTTAIDASPASVNPTYRPLPAKGGPKDHVAWNEENNGLSQVDAYTARLLSDAGTKVDAEAQLESMHHLRLDFKSGGFPVKGWEGAVAGNLSGLADWGSFGTSGLLNTGLAKAGAFGKDVNSRGVANEKTLNDKTHYIAHAAGAIESLIAAPLLSVLTKTAATITGGIAASSAANQAAAVGTGVAGESAIAKGLSLTQKLAQDKIGILKNIVKVAAPAAGINVGEELNREINFEKEVNPNDLMFAGAVGGAFGLAAHGALTGAVASVPVIKAGGGKFLNKLSKAYKQTEGKWVVDKVLKSPEEIAAAEAVMNKPYVSQTKETKYTGGVNTKEEETIARQIVKEVQAGASPEEAADNAAADYHERTAKQGKGPVKVSKSRTNKDVVTEGETTNVKDTTTGDDGKVTTKTNTSGKKNTVTEVEKRAFKERSDSMDFDGDFRPLVDAEYIPHPSEMKEKDLVNHINENGGFQHPDVKEHVVELRNRQNTVRNGIQKAAEHFGEDTHGSRLHNHAQKDVEPLTVHFDPNDSPEMRQRKVGEWFEKMFEHDPKDSALHKAGQQFAKDYKETRNPEAHAAWQRIQAYLDRKYPRKRLPNGNVQPGFRDTANIYRREMGYTDSNEMLKITGHVPGEDGGASIAGEGANGYKPPEPFTTDEQRNFESQTTDTRNKIETTTKYPKPPKFDKFNYKERYVPGRVTPHFTKAGAAAAGIFAHGANMVIPGIGQYVIGAVGMDYAIAAALTQRAAAGKIFLKYGAKAAKLSGESLKLLTRQQRGPLLDYAKEQLRNEDAEDNDHEPFGELKPNDVEHTNAQYDAMTRAKTAMVSNPDNFTMQLQMHVGDAMPPTVTQQYIQKSLAAAQALEANLAKDPRPPAMRSTPYNPPHSVKLKQLRDFHSLLNPAQALRNPTPQRMHMIEQVHPEALDQFRRGLLGAVQNPDVKLTSEQARKISIILGGPVTTRNDPAYIKRLQQTSADKPEDDQAAGAMVGKGQASINGKPSAKIASQVPLMFDPDPNVNNIQG